ncbi:MAG: hypothetical protein HWE11_12915 [Gammaproteobacteria bacterium]|nr:hypothetical protein [Gammaproteobacteria bacterium]
MTIDRNYISAMDKFLSELDKQPETQSESRINESNKYKKINKLRDNPQESSNSETLWEDF